MKFLFVLLLGSISAYASEVCIIKQYNNVVINPGISCNGEAWTNLGIQVSGILQKKLDQQFEIKSINPVGEVLYYTLIKP